MELFKALPTLSDIVVKNFKLDIDGDHGKYHWNRVYLNTLMLSKYYSIIDTHFFALFALFHDSSRENEYWDEEHGKRGGDLLKTLLHNDMPLYQDELDKLCFACANHTSPNLKHQFAQDLMVHICWDADRLDLGRVFIKPDPKYFFTDYAKKIAENLI